MAYQSAPLKIITQNCRGLNIPERRTHLLQELKKKHVAIAMLQETHFKEGSPPRLRNRHYPNNYFCNHPIAHKSGVAILLAAELEFKELECTQDSQGRYLFLKGTIADKINTIATIYVPNKRQAPFLRNALQQLEDFTDGILLIVGDFNTPLDPTLDSSTGHSCLSQHNIRSIRQSMEALRLVDCWRTLHPTVKDFTYYSALHNRYSRIDYILIAQEGLSHLRGAKIETGTWSDHGSVEIELDSPLYRPTAWTWRLNEALLLDLDTKEQTQQALEQYFRENDSPETSPISIWEAHKSVIHGVLIRIASRKRKAFMHEMVDLYQLISTLERQHKRSQLNAVYGELMEHRRKLKDLILKRHLRSVQRTKGFYYIYANKGGK
ncbi:Hypothetical predicted protein [Pelobates cultripes]|uniref:exodeoxyribonuclease III n=1 Tax=Pelobates cultripes TaxID=61616 RepID=A0AAD1RFM3_PELCU|nr:Hypothetical predicted protein [Pelobates cultripes]